MCPDVTGVWHVFVDELGLLVAPFIESRLPAGVDQWDRTVHWEEEPGVNEDKQKWTPLPPLPLQRTCQVLNDCEHMSFWYIQSYFYILNLIWAMIRTLPWNFTMHQSICSLDSMVDFNWTWQWQSEWKKRIAINVTAIVMYACSVEIWCMYVDRLALISPWRLYVIPIINV